MGNARMQSLPQCLDHTATDNFLPRSPQQETLHDTDSEAPGVETVEHRKCRVRFFADLLAGGRLLRRDANHFGRCVYGRAHDVPASISVPCRGTWLIELPRSLILIMGRLLEYGRLSRVSRQLAVLKSTCTSNRERRYANPLAMSRAHSKVSGHLQGDKDGRLE